MHKRQSVDVHAASLDVSVPESLGWPAIKDGKKEKNKRIDDDPSQDDVSYLVDLLCWENLKIEHDQAGFHHAQDDDVC